MATTKDLLHFTRYITPKLHNGPRKQLCHDINKIMFLLLLLVAAASGQSYEAPGSDQIIEWGECPPNQDVSAYRMTCANLTFPLNYDDPLGENVTAFVRRIYSKAPTDSGIWMIAGGPGDSSLPLVYACDYFIAMDPTFTCYCQDARGTGLSSYMSCGQTQPYGPFNPNNQTSVDMYKSCFEDIVTKHGDNLQYYSAYNAMKDLAGTIEAINPDTVHIYSQSVGTYQLNTYLQLPGSRVDVAVMDGPVPPNRWSLENNAEWASQVAQDVAFGCVTNSSVCKDRLSNMGHIPKLVMDSIIDQTLPCVANLTWLQGAQGQFWASVYNNFCTGGDVRATAHLCLGPMWFRLHRCSESDIEQLNFFHSYQQVIQNSVPDPLYYSLGVAITIGASELYSYSKSPMSYDDQVQRSARMFSDATVEMMVSYARTVVDIPLYESEYYMQFANRPEVPILMLVGTYDANTENGLGFWYQEGLGNNTQLLNIPYNSHVTFDFDAPCTDSIILEFFQSLGTSYDTSCLADIEPPDFDGSTEAAKNYSIQLFGTDDLWNDGYAVDVVTTTTSSTIDTSSSTTKTRFSSSLASSFNLLDALQPDQLLELVMGSIDQFQDDADSVAKYVELCQQCLEALHRIQTSNGLTR